MKILITAVLCGTLLAGCAFVSESQIRKTERVPVDSFFQTPSETNSGKPISSRHENEGTGAEADELEIRTEDAENDALESVTDQDVEELVNSLFSSTGS